MAKITNVSPGPRFFHVEGRTVHLDPGQSWEGDISDEHLEAVEKRNEGMAEPDFEINIEGIAGENIASGGSTDEFDSMSDESLRIFITDRDGRAPPANTSRAKLLEKARSE